MDINAQADTLVKKIKHHLITTTGHTSKSATTEEFYQAFSTILREEIMINHTATIETIQTKKPRILNFLSMEYLPGRLLTNNIANMSASELVKAITEKMGWNFSELVSCESDPGLGNGGLGRLSSCFLDSLASMKYPARGYGLRYQYGIFEQEVWNGVQVERPDCWLLNSDPWEMRRDLFSTTVRFRGKPVKAQNKHGDEVYLLEDFEEVRALPYDIPIIGHMQKDSYSVLLLRLWSTKESPRNFQLQRYNAGLLDQAAENTSLTDVLYPNDNNELGKRIRLKQEFILVSASLQDIIRRHLRVYGDLSDFGDKVRIQINDTHPALVIAELVRILTKSYDFSWAKAWETCQACCSYTNHTILRESLEEWNEKRVEEYIPRQIDVIRKLNQEFCNQVRSRFPNDEEKVRRLSIIENGQIRMAHLAIYGCHKVNGVSEIHTDIIKKDLFKDFTDLYPEKFVNVTNGVTHRRWLAHCNPLLKEFITRRIGSSWINDFSQIARLKEFASKQEAQEEFLWIKKKNKEALINYLSKESALRDASGKIVKHPHTLEPTSLFDVQIKRIHEYKRQLLAALHLIMVYQELQMNPNARSLHRFSLFAGTAAPGYKRAKQIIQLLSAISRKFHNDQQALNRICVSFVEGYNVSKAELIIPAADLSEQISTAGWEASGTGNMKLAMNGALTIGTEDGANIEMRKAVTDQWWPFRFGSTIHEVKQPYRPEDIYHRDEPIRRALESLKNGTFSENAAEEEAFKEIYHSLIETDYFQVLRDLRSYYETQKKVEALYLQPKAWAEMAIHNIAAMGQFSTDTSIRNYAEKVWGIKPCPIDTETLKKIRNEYNQYDVCMIR